LNSPPTPSIASAPTADESAAEVPCPRCGGKLINPGSLGWCPKCGYCQSLDADAAKVVVPSKAGPHKPSPLGIVEFFDMLAKLPAWLWVTLGGITVVVLVSLAADFLLADDSLPRALWSTGELALGLLLLLVAQVWLFVQLAPNDDRLSAKDIILSARLWSLGARRLPETRGQVWFGVWSSTAVLCAVFVVGGFSYWYQFYKPKKIADKNLIAAALAKGKEKNNSLTESVEDFAKTQDLTKKDDKKDKAKPKPVPRLTVDSVIIGYTLEGKAKVSSLIVATLRNDQLKYAGVVRRGLTPANNKELFPLLTEIRRPDPIIPDLKIAAAIWVDPEVFCEVRYSGLDDFGRLKDAELTGLLQEDK
jgi:hypothetical protein